MRTLKKTIIRGLAVATGLEALRNNKLVLVTPIGVISGYLCDEDNLGQDATGEVLLSTITEKLTTDFGEDNIEGNDGYLLLSDVKVQTGANMTYNLPNLIVFYDQIIGVTLGNPA